MNLNVELKKKKSGYKVKADRETGRRIDGRDVRINNFYFVKTPSSKTGYLDFAVGVLLMFTS